MINAKVQCSLQVGKLTGLILLIGTFLAGIPLHSQTTVQSGSQPYMGPVYKRPVTPRPILSPKVNNYVVDEGDQGQDTHLVARDLTLVMPTPYQWSRVMEKGTSVAFYFRGDRRVTLSLTLFSKEEFIPDLSDQSIVGYIEGLKRQYRTLVTIISKEGEYEGQGRFGSVLDSDVKHVVYDLKSKDQETTYRVHDYFFLVQNQIINARLRGPIEKLNLVERDFEYLVSTLYIYEPE